MEDSKRAPNFTQDEVERLKNCVKKYANIVECKKSDVLSQKQKTDGWMRIEKDFNVENVGVYRKHFVLKKKWDNIKKSCKKKYSEMKMYTAGTGGGAPKVISFTPVEEGVLEVIGPQATGLRSIYDCDVDENDDLNTSTIYDHSKKFENDIDFIDNLPSTSGIQLLTVTPSSDNKIHDITNTADWQNYTPRLLKNPVSKELQFDKEAAGSKPCRLHAPWLSRANPTAKRQQIKQLLPIRTSPIPFSDVESVTVTSTCTQTDICTISESNVQTSKISRSVGTQTESSNHIVDNETKPKPPELIRILKEFALDAETLVVKMPVGTNFENSALKASFSLSSLQPSTGLEGGEHVNGRVKNERLYNSLTKKRKDPKQDSWRRSWGSTCENKDDFWSALQANYDYIMDNHLIDSCQEIDQDMRDQTEEKKWTFSHFITQFSELYGYLSDVQDAIYGKTENVTNWQLRASYMEEMTRMAPQRKLFNEQASRLCYENPSVQDEVTWRLKHLNSKWDQVENALSSNGCSRCEQDSCPDVEHEVRCLRKWVKDMEARLQPLNFHIEWTLPELEKKALEHMVLQRDIENHSKIVCSVVKLCNRSVPKDAKCHASNAKRVASGLERRYHLLFLRSLEWQCHIEDLVKLHNNRNQDFSSDCESDEEPCSKQPRLSCDYNGYTSSQTSEDEEPMSLTDLDNETDFGSESTSIKMVNTLGTLQSDDDREPGHDLDLNEPTNEILKQDENTTKNGTAHITPKDKANNKERNTLHKLTLSVDLPGESNGTIANVGSYYYKHRDTDSEFDTMDSIKSLEKDEIKCREESTEDEFTYSPGEIEPIVELDQDVESEPTPSKESIKLLVQKADELIASPNRVDPCMFKSEQQKHKLSRVKEWLNFETEKPSDSCDASGECTSGEDEDKESISSEDFNESVVTCRPQVLNNSRTFDSSTNLVPESVGDIFTSPECVKVNLRPKRLPMKGNRPWSVACLSQLSQTSPVKGPNDHISNFSISESALNKLAPMSPVTSANSIGHTMHGNSTSSTVEESVLAINEGNRPVSLRKKKMRLRRKHIGRKPESGSESQYLRSPGTNSLPSPTKCHGPSNLVKSGSFSGCGNRMIYQERSTASDPASKPHRGKGKGDTSTTSGADSEDDKRFHRLPNFMLGPRVGVVNTYCSPLKGDLDRDSSPEKSSLNTGEEHSSSLSEQAWDNYQDKYSSENYSEAHDSDAARRLLEFGEDYCTFLDSQSDCWSGTSKNSPQPKRKSQGHPFADSDSETEDVKNFIQESKTRLTCTQDIYNKYLTMATVEFMFPNDCGEIIATCERHIYSLEVIIDANDDTRVLPDCEVQEVKALMSDWMDLKLSAKKMQTSRALHNEMMTFKEDLAQYTSNLNPSQVEFQSKDEMSAEITRLTEIHNAIQDKNRRLLELNVTVHHFVVKKIPGGANLKSEVSELYSLWHDMCQSVSDRVESLKTHIQIWAQLETRLDKFQSDLRNDEETLQLIDNALQDGFVSTELKTSIKDVAKVLSETHGAASETCTKTLSSIVNDVFKGGMRNLSISLLTEGNISSGSSCGSYSDSGISDEGSELERSEREHRLAAIRRLVRQLEAIMAPDSEARVTMSQRLEQAEAELRKLQTQCRGLIVRTAVCNAIRGDVKADDSALSSPCSSMSRLFPASDPDDSDPDDRGSLSWFWRVMKASVPFQMAIVAIICVACLLEPSCCDSINNLNLSLTPQLRYVRGPPPV